MSDTLDGAKLSDIIQAATREMVERTETFLQSVQDDPVGSDAISMMLNGKELVLSRDNYNLLKSQNESTKKQMKAAIKAVSAQRKTRVKAKPE